MLNCELLWACSVYSRGRQKALSVRIGVYERNIVDALEVSGAHNDGNSTREKV